jgi:non-ribosomal peptide synthetase component F
MLGVWASRVCHRERVLLGTAVRCSRGDWVAPIAVDGDGETSFATLVRRVERQIDEVAQRDRVDLDVLARALALHVTTGRAPVVQAVITDGEAADPLRENVPYDIMVSLGSNRQRPSVARFRRGVFTVPEAQRTVEQLEDVLEQSLRHARKSICDLSALSPRDAARLRAINATKAPLPDRDIAWLLARQTATAPNRIAIVDRGEDMTYAELDARAERLADALVAMGVRADDRVVVCLDRSADLVAVLVAILKAGAAYVALEADLPTRRVQTMLTRAPPRLAVIGPSADGVFAHVPTVTLVELDAATLTAPSRRVVRRRLDDLAYVSFTSGSTGEPKGVAVPHRGIVRLVHRVDYADLGPDRKVLQFAPVAFDASTWEIWGTLANGAALHVFPTGVPAPADSPTSSESTASIASG